MKICAIICEFNPFHNGHKYLLEQARQISGCDKLLCIMSGSFTQRGEICVLDKHIRARHAVLSGVDCVLELPAPFAVAPAEIFAKGAIKILSSIPEVTCLAFGCESGEKSEFLTAAKILLNETENFKKVLQTNLESGNSYIKSYSAAFESAGGNPEFLSSPNNVLGLEYTKAILSSGANIDILPIKRVGAGFTDSEIKGNYSSATAIRNNLSSPLLKSNVPDFVLADLKDFSKETEKFKEFVRLVLSRTDAETLKRVYGCGEGLENRLKSLENLPYNEIVESCTNRRYSSARITRILCANFLELYQSDCESFLNSPLYLKPLAVNKQSEILTALSKSSYPIVIKGRDREKLSETAKKCLEKDEFTYKQWQQITNQNIKPALV